MDNPLGLPGSPTATALLAELEARWSEPHRRYHTRAHLHAVLTAIDTLAAHADDLLAVRLAAWFHDAVYDGRPGHDEERSAQLAHTRLTACGYPAAAEVARLVRVTATHTPNDRDAAVLCDADLSILGAPPATYDHYSHAIRQEYHHVPINLFKTGRTEVLTRLLAKDPLFHTPTAQSLWTEQATKNLARELAFLRI
ncbi:metal-dependent phosphohydrolase [Acrocarpospora sp. B8E8]|uniref:HD domain-containing protein n=1 Tax=Acrocarpospora sp. B8E8 TaxID=3153572 RepID=UPI00325C5CF5